MGGCSSRVEFYECVVCGNLSTNPDEFTLRNSGYKCHDCVGKPAGSGGPVKPFPSYCQTCNKMYYYDKDCGCD